MPTYDYRCTKCGHRFELFHSILDEKLKRCPRCKSKAVRVPTGGAGILFKGSGFYITDYRSSSYKEQAKRERSGSDSAANGPGGASGGSDKGVKSDTAGKSDKGGKSEKRGKSEKGGTSDKGGTTSRSKADST